jgi:hypothetical protein
MRSAGAAPRRGRRVDLHRLAAFLHGPPPKASPALPATDRGADIAALAHAVELRSWAAGPDPGQRALVGAALDCLRRAGAGRPALVGAALDCLRRAGAGRPALVGAALGLRGWVAGDPAAPRCAPPCSYWMDAGPSAFSGSPLGMGGMMRA